MKTMRTTGFIVFLIGAFSTLNGIVGVVEGGLPNYVGVAFILLGAFLMTCADKKKVEAVKKKQWNQWDETNTQPKKLNHISLKNTESQNLERTPLRLQSQLN